jgi:hypothetical protein
MSDLYLIAHKVRGEAAFDVAIQMECPICLEAYEVTGDMGCDECDQLGYWWIIPTSGHRAYPYATILLQQLGVIGWGEVKPYNAGIMPKGLPDHYPDHGTAPKIDLIAALGLKPRPPAKFERRI